MKTSKLQFLHVLSTLIITSSLLVISFVSDEVIPAYGQENESFLIWSDEFICEDAEKILEKHDKHLEQLPWISRDNKEREKLISQLSFEEIEILIACQKQGLSNLKSEIITKKIGYFEGENSHDAIGVARVITIENKNYLRFEHFELGFSGKLNPDLHVYLTKHDDFSDSIYLEKLKINAGSKNYPLRNIDVDEYDTVIIYDEISKEIFSIISMSDSSFLIDMFTGFYYNFKEAPEYPKVESKIIDKKTGVLHGSDDFESVGRIETPYEEDIAELKFEKFKISKGYDFHLYATEEGDVKKSGDWIFGPDNLLYVSNTNTNEVLRYDDTGTFHDVFITADDNGGLQGPKDLIFSPDGVNLYVSSFITNEILRYDGKTGQFIEKFIDKNRNNDGLKRPMKMLFDHDGKYLYVTSVDTNQIFKYDVETDDISYIIENKNLLNNPPELVTPISLALDSNGFLYVGNPNTNEVLRYDDTGTFHDVFITADDNGGLQGPKDLIFSPDGVNLYVSSFITNEILRYDGKTGQFIEKFVTANNGDISNPKFMTFGSDENLYVSSVETGQILRFDGTTGNFLDVFVNRNPEELTSPKGLSFGPNGDLFVSNDDDNSVLRYFNNGTSNGVFVYENLLSMIDTDPSVTNATDLNNSLNNTVGGSVDFVNKEPSFGLLDPEGVVFSPECEINKNNLILNNNSINDECYFLVTSSKNNLIFRYVYNEHNESIFKDAFINDEKIKNPQNLIFGPDNNLYVSSFDTDEILRFDGITGKFIDVFASSGGLDGPIGMAFDDNSSSFFVSSNNSNQVLKYDSHTGEFQEILIQDVDLSLQKPESLIIGPDNNLYVSSSKTNQILQYDLNGNLLERFVSDKSGGLYRPKDLIFNNDEHLCVNSSVTNDIKCYAQDDGKLLSIINIAFNNNLLGKPNSNLGPDRELYVSETLSSVISRYDANTNLFSSTILSGEEDPLQRPRSIVFGPDNNLYVASNNNHQILRFDGETGRFIDIFVTHSSGGLSSPQDLVFYDGNLYVTSNDNHRVLRYNQVTGAFIDDFIKSRDGGLTGPKGMVFDDNGHLYVASNENHKILQYNAITGLFEKNLETGDELLNPVGLVIDNQGNLIVSSSGNDTVLSYNIKSPILVPTIVISDEFVDDPSGLVFDSENDLVYVSSGDSNRILTYDLKNNSINEIDELIGTGQLENPHGLTIKDGELFISNINSNKIIKYDPEQKTSELFHSGSFGVLGPLGLNFDPNGNLYVISGITHEIFRYDVSTGNLLGKFSHSPFVNTDGKSLPNGQFQDLVFSQNGVYLFVTSMYTGQILLFDNLGQYLGVFIDSKKDGLNHPQNIIYGPDKKLFYINNFDTGSIFVYDAETGEFISKLIEDPRLDIKKMKFGPDGLLYLTVDNYAKVIQFDTESGNLKEFDMGGIYLGSLDENLLKTKYSLNNINTTRHDTIVVYDHLLERSFATVPLQDDLVADFLPLPVIWNMLNGNNPFAVVSDPIFASKEIFKQSGYSKGIDDITALGQVKLAHTEDITEVTLETFEIRYDTDEYVSLFTERGITNGPRLLTCFTVGIQDNCDDKKNSVILLGPMMANVGDLIFQAKNVNLNKFDTILIYDTLFDKKFAEIPLRDAEYLRVSPELFVDWFNAQFIIWPLVLLFIFLPLTFDYVRTIFKTIFLSLHLSKNKKEKNLPPISTTKKITIMIPAHNEESGIKASIDAALKTKYKNKEIIVIDDKSTDNTFAIAKEFSDKGLIKLLHRKQASGSKASALNYGFAYATGDLILCMDGDTLLDESSLQNAINYFDDKEVKAVSGNVKILSGDDGIVNTLTKSQSYEYLIAIELGRSYTSILNILLVISGAFGIFRREIFSGTGKFDKDTITEDFDLTLKVRKTKGKIPFVRDSIARTYCPNNWTAWMKQRQRWAHGQMQTLKKHKDLMLSSKFTRRDRIAMFDMWALDIIMNFLFVIYLIALGPASVIMIVYGNVHILVNVLALIIATYLVSETIIFVFAIMVSHQYKYFRYLYLVPFMALFYRPFLKIVIFKSYINAARNKEATWE